MMTPEKQQRVMNALGAATNFIELAHDSALAELLVAELRAARSILAANGFFTRSREYLDAKYAGDPKPEPSLGAKARLRDIQTGSDASDDDREPSVEPSSPESSIVHDKEQLERFLTAAAPKD